MLTWTAPRLQQATSPPPELSQSDIQKLECPLCSYKPPKNREVDLRRHFECHYQTAKHVCNGVRVDRAADYRITDLSNVQDYEGERRVGRHCMKVFSRKDALLRHLRNENCECVCDVLPSSFYVTIKRI